VVHALKAEDGSSVWCTTIPKSSDSPARFVFDPINRQLIVSAHWKSLYSLDISTGEMLWQNNSVPLWFRSATPAIIDGEIYTAGISYLCKVGLNTGAITQTMNTVKEVFDSTSYPVTDGEYVYYSSSTMGVVAVEKTHLNIVRHYPASRSVVHTVPYVTGDAQSVESHPILYKDMLIFGASDGYLYIYEKDSEKLLKKYELGSPCLTSPIVEDDKITIVTMDGEVLTYSL
jgi:outer membrane protein assembly factor BamB